MTNFAKAMTSTTKQGWKGHAERGLNMKLLGHDVPKTFVLLSTFEGFLFLFLVHAVSEASLSLFGGDGAPLNLAFKIILTAVFLLVGTSIGLFNKEATQSFGNYLRRLALTWPVVLLTGAYLVASDRLFIQAALPGALLLDLALQLTLVMLTIFAARVALVWGIGLAFLQTRVMVLGDGALADAVTRFVEGPGRGQFRYLQTIREWSPVAVGLPGAIVGNLRLAALPAGAPLSALAEMLKAEEIIVAVEDRTALPLAELLECKLKGIGVIDALTFWERESGQIDADVVGEGWLAFGGGFALSQRRRLLKRSADLLISLTFLVAIAPLCLLVALIVKLESAGPIFYRQERVGLNGRVFKVWKFRSMRAEAEADGVARWATARDDRVTGFGRFIRKCRIDEIPQVLNVLSGEMSFIGPRPERPYFVDQLKQQIPYYDMRHRVRPGITGWAQVNYPYGASIEDAKRKLAYDLYYLKNGDLLLDLAILAQTVRVVLFSQGAR
ncbi:TIGR03013 family XrtA/PEP-CTERM system glycosyltransferase [Caulobacter segnis]